MIPPSRPTTCSGIIALFEPVLTAFAPVVIAGEENKPPAAASQTVTVTESPTVITGSVDILRSPNWALKLPKPRRLSASMVLGVISTSIYWGCSSLPTCCAAMSPVLGPESGKDPQPASNIRARPQIAPERPDLGGRCMICPN